MTAAFLTSTLASLSSKRVLFPLDCEPSPSELTPSLPTPSRPFDLSVIQNVKPTTASRYTLTFKPLPTLSPSFTLDFDALSKPHQLLSAILPKLQLDTSNDSFYRLLVNGKVLEWDLTLRESGIQEKAVVYIAKVASSSPTSSPSSSSGTPVITQSTPTVKKPVSTTTAATAQPQKQLLSGAPTSQFWKELTVFLATQFPEKTDADKVYAEFKKAVDNLVASGN